MREALATYTPSVPYDNRFKDMVDLFIEYGLTVGARDKYAFP